MGLPWTYQDEILLRKLERDSYVRAWEIGTGALDWRLISLRFKRGYNLSALEKFEAMAWEGQGQRIGHKVEYPCLAQDDTTLQDSMMLSWRSFGSIVLPYRHEAT